MEALSELLAHNDLIDAFFLDPHMTDAEANVSSSIHIYAEDAPSSELVIQIEQLLAWGHEIFGILKQVEAYQIAAQQGFKDLNTLRKYLDDLAIWESWMQEEAYEGLRILTSQVGGH